MRKNNKGFTLIELLAVVIIIGVLTLIAIPAISKYIENSRVSVYVTSAKKYIDIVMQEVNNQSEGYVTKVGSCINVKISDIQLEKGTNLKSPFGYLLDKYSYITVYNINGTHLYLLTIVDSMGFGWVYQEYSSINNSNIIRDISTDSLIPISGSDTCTVGLLYGDINLDNKVSLADINILKRYLVGKIELSSIQLALADVNLDGKVNHQDKLIMDKFFRGEISKLPYTLENNTSTLSAKILEDNKAYSDNIASQYVTSSTGIDFSQVSSDTNGKGLYYTSTNTENSKTTYYFRGNVTNNYVSFAGTTWRVVRINEDGSIRLITQKSVATSMFNSSNNDNAYVGYMYGTTGSSTYALTHTNTNSSIIKTYLDTWYQSNLASYSSYLADAGFCNDRSIASTSGSWYTNDTALGYGTNTTYYGAYNRLDNLSRPQFACPQSKDLFTTSSSNKGNKALTYPIGLLTADELWYAGGTHSENANYYLVNGSNFWTMSPSFFTSYIAGGWRTVMNRAITHDPVSAKSGVRPVINLKSTVEISVGSGTSSDPYVVKVS